MIGIILAGGGGTRLWPYSRSMIPKQFLNLGHSQETLLQETFSRLAKKISPSHLYIVGTKNHEFELLNQIHQICPEFSKDNLLLEPCGRNTAAAILWGLLKIPASLSKEAVVIVPSDHLIQNPLQFIEDLYSGAHLAADNWLVTFGIQPDRPETGYGYIRSGEALSRGFKVSEFVEKPNLEHAKQYLSSGQYTWNAGIFMATVGCLLEQFALFTPDLYKSFLAHIDKDSTHNEEFIKFYESLPSLSIDYGILEKSSQVAVIPINVGWSDLGSWESLYQISQKDQNGNVVRGHVITHDTKNCLIFSSKKLVTTLGVDNLIVVETDDALLVCDIHRAQDVKKLVETLKSNDRYEYKFHTTVNRPWGKYTVLHESPSFKIKILEITPDKRLSLQRHHHRSEHWVVVQGTADVVRGVEQFFLTENQSTYIPKATIHRLGNSGKIPLQIIEVQEGEYLEEDDIERFDDDFGRIGAN